MIGAVISDEFTSMNDWKEEIKKDGKKDWKKGSKEKRKRKRISRK